MVILKEDLVKDKMPSPLFDFAYFPDWEGSLDYLSRLSQQENWDYRFAHNHRPYPILNSYVHYTFSRIQEQKKITETKTHRRACFNTGLVTPNYEEIYATFDSNHRKDAQPFVFSGFFKESERAMLDFDALPDLASYFDNPSELLYDSRLDLRKSVDHIIDENKERFPEPFRSMQDNHQLRISLNGAVDYAVRRIQRNYRTAVPQFYQGRIQLLLPICMTNRSHADLALVVYKQNNVYLASTCLTLDMAYNNARLLSRPDSDWLEP